MKNLQYDLFIFLQIWKQSKLTSILSIQILNGVVSKPTLPPQLITRNKAFLQVFMMSIQSESHKNGDRGSELQKDGNGGVRITDGNGRCNISNGTSSKDPKLVESSSSTIDGNEKLALEE